MTTRFYDAMTALAPLHWWRMHAVSVATEPDVGSDPDSPMDNISGTVTSRESGPLEAGETTYSAGFSGTSYIERAASWSSNDFAGTSDGSVVFWFKSSYSGADQFIMGQHPDNYAFYFMLRTTGTMYVVAINGSDARTLTSDVTGYNDGDWHLFAFTGDGTNPNRMYVDGSEVTYTTATGGAGLNDHFWMQPTTGLFYVGESPRSAVTLPFSGYISELALFSYALSASEVYSLWDATQTPPPPTPGEGGHRYKGRKAFVGF